jgi:hypothetical protein
LKVAVDNIKVLGSNEEQREGMVKTINNILFSNALYLIRELMEIYGQIDLPKDVLKLDKSEASDFEILDEKTVAVKEALSDMDVLLLNTIHWNILCDLVTNDVDFQQDFVANIYNNFSGNILFTIAYNALNSILLKKELNVSRITTSIVSKSPKHDLPATFERCNFLTPILISTQNENFTKIIERCYHLHEISQSFVDKLRDENEEFALVYRRCDKKTKFRTLVHRDVFLNDNVNENSTRSQQILNDDDQFFFHHSWLNQFVVGIFEGKCIRDRFVQIINRFVRTEDELKAIHRVNIIKEITGRCGIKYLSSIARNCFDICWRLSDNISFSKY